RLHLLNHGSIPSSPPYGRLRLHLLPSGSGARVRTSTQDSKGPCAAVTPPPIRQPTYRPTATPMSDALELLEWHRTSLRQTGRAPAVATIRTTRSRAGTRDVGGGATSL